MKRKCVLWGLLLAWPVSQPWPKIVTPADPFTGWSWYNEPKKPAELPKKPQQPAPQSVPDMSKLSAQEQAKVLRGYTMEALNRAILYPTKENTATFLRWQKFWTDRGRCSASPLRQRS
jgi:conjugal transfer pilus assembly protein TraF